MKISVGKGKNLSAIFFSKLTTRVDKYQEPIKIIAIKTRTKAIIYGSTEFTSPDHSEATARLGIKDTNKRLFGFMLFLHNSMLYGIPYFAELGGIRINRYFYLASLTPWVVNILNCVDRRCEVCGGTESLPGNFASSKLGCPLVKKWSSGRFTLFL